MEALGYWIPTGGPAKKRRRLVYLLRHESRYDAYRNWVNFSNDREWERVLDKPEFQGLLAKKPESVFLNEKPYSRLREVAIKQPGGIYELRIYAEDRGETTALENWFEGQLRPLFSKHGMREIGSWAPFDKPSSGTSFFSLLYHKDRDQVEAAWKGLHRDLSSKQEAVNEDFLSTQSDVIFLRALGFSPLK